MIIPVRCFTCGKVLADKWLEYEKRVKEYRLAMERDGTRKPDQTLYLDGSPIQTSVPTPERRAMDELQLSRYCCRKIFLTHRNIMDKI
jgi:DNA-directed RNA polymerase subunit N (RpoN/RPB10)